MSCAVELHGTTALGIEQSAHILKPHERQITMATTAEILHAKVMQELTNSVEYFHLKRELNELSHSETIAIGVELENAFRAIIMNEYSIARGFINRAEVIMH